MTLKVIKPIEECEYFETPEEFMEYYQEHKEEVDHMTTHKRNKLFCINGHRLGTKLGELIVIKGSNNTITQRVIQLETEVSDLKKMFCRLREEIDEHQNIIEEILLRSEAAVEDS
jgi:hypothetical protein